MLQLLPGAKPQPVFGTALQLQISNPEPGDFSAAARLEGESLACPLHLAVSGFQAMPVDGLEPWICFTTTIPHGDQRAAGPAWLPSLTHAVTMMKRAKRQGPIMFHTPLRSSCRDMAINRVPNMKRTWERDTTIAVRSSSAETVQPDMPEDRRTSSGYPALCSHKSQKKHLQEGETTEPTNLYPKSQGKSSGPAFTSSQAHEPNCWDKTTQGGVR